MVKACVCTYAISIFGIHGLGEFSEMLINHQLSLIVC